MSYSSSQIIAEIITANYALVKPCDNKDDLDPYRLQATGDMGFPELASAENPKLNAFHWGGYIRVSPSSPASDNSSLHI
jgi:hypothetical protein